MPYYVIDVGQDRPSRDYFLPCPSAANSLYTFILHLSDSTHWHTTQSQVRTDNNGVMMTR